MIKKLGIKEGFTIEVVDPPADYWALLGELPRGVTKHAPADTPMDFVHLFVTRKADLERWLSEAKERMKPRGMVWVSWPKKTSGKATDLTENVVREVALACGLVDVKVCAIDQTWSGLKLVQRLKDRGNS